MGGKLLGGKETTRTEADQVVVEFVKQYAEHITTWQICGSYRRGKARLGDIDLVVQTSQEKRLLLNMSIQKDYGVPWSHARKPILINGVQLEVHLCLPEYWGAMILYATGSGGWNSGLRLKAAERGLKLNRYGLWDGKTRIAGETEEEIFEALNEDFVEPEDRR